MATELETLADLATVRTLLLQRVSSEQVRIIDQMFLDIAEAIRTELQSAKPLTEFKRQRINAIIADLQALVILPAPDITELAAIEAAATVTNLAAVSVVAKLPPAATLERIANAALIEGAVIKDWFANIEEKTRFEVARTVRAGVAAGRTNYQITKDITGLVSEGNLGREALKQARRDATAVTRTAVQTVANDAAMAVYQENSDVLLGLEYVATLDGRTTPQCAALDGMRWEMDGTPMKGTTLPLRTPPIHWNCRSTLVPFTRLSDLDEGTRAAMGGPVSAKIRFEQFMNKQGPEFAAQILGPGRYEFYKANRLTLSQLIDPRSLEPLTLAELREKFGK